MGKGDGVVGQGLGSCAGEVVKGVRGNRDEGSACGAEE